jgi:hypothetical protein
LRALNDQEELMTKLTATLLAGAFALATAAAYAQMSNSPAPKTGNAPNGVTTSTSGVEKDETMSRGTAKSGMKKSSTKKNQTTGAGSTQGTTSKPGAGVDKD